MEQSLNELYSRIRRAVSQEKLAQERNKRQMTLNIEEAELLEERPGQLLYRIRLAEPIKVPNDSTLRLRIPKEPKPIEVQVLTCQDKELVVVSAVPLALEAALIKVEFDATFILRKLDDRLYDVMAKPRGPLRALIEKDLVRQASSPPETDPTGLNSQQQAAWRKMLSEQVHLLWGPPGTGKTHTLGETIASHVRAGRSCLLLSMSNVAVDEMVKATGRALGPAEAQRLVYRAGVALQEDAKPYSSVGHLEREDPYVSRAWKSLQTYLSHLMRKATSGKGEIERSLYEEIRKVQEDLNRYTLQAKEADEKLAREAQCVAATLASLVLRDELATRGYDVVIIDEASMVSMPFAIVGGAQAQQHLIYAGDFRQLPPICVSNEYEAITWFGRSVFDYLDVPAQERAGTLPPYISMLNEQFRMTSIIGAIVSELSYGGRLETNEGKPEGLRPLFIDVREVWPTSWFSVYFKSYYHPFTALLLASLKRRRDTRLGPRALLLTPFKAQAMVFQALGKDLSDTEYSFEGSTVHKAQGAQEHTVIVDLTAHNDAKAHQFFTSETAENLLNVAMSRAQEHLVVIGNTLLVAKLASQHDYWRRFKAMVDERFEVIKAQEVLRGTALSELVPQGAIERLGTGRDETSLPVLVVAKSDQDLSDELAHYAGALKASTKLFVSRDPKTREFRGGLVYRQDRNLDALMMAKGCLALPFRRANGAQVWAALHLPQTTKQLLTVGCRHLIEEDFNTQQTLRLGCERCSGSLYLSHEWGRYLLACECGYTRRLGYSDAQVLIEVHHLRCGLCGAKPAPRQGSQGALFVGCSNYPACNGKIDLHALCERRSSGPGRWTR